MPGAGPARPYWTTQEPYPRPRPRTLAERVAAGILSEEEAAAAEARVQYNPRLYTFFARFATAGFAVVVSPSMRGPALLKHLTFTHFVDNSGQPAEIVLHVSTDPGGQEANGAGSYTVRAGDRVVWESSILPFGLVFSRDQFLPGSGVGTSQQIPHIPLNYLVHDDQFFIKLEFESPNVGTFEAGGLVLVYENVRLEQLAPLLA